MSHRATPIAIIGMGCRFPGATNLFEFWANVLANRDCTREVPADRWDARTFRDPSSPAGELVACGRGGYLDTPIPFDAPAFGIMPRVVAGGEPEQFLVLDAARQALADAGLDPENLPSDRVEVVVGRGNYFNRGNLLRLQHGRVVAQTVGLLGALHPEWMADDREALRLDLKASLPPFEAATIPGQLTNATAGRLANRFDLTGATFVVDAASASSLVAADLGCRALRERRADLALVGGVYAEADVDFSLVFQQLGALSRSGESRPFTSRADGLVPGEGVGVLVLKRLADAERDGDRVYAVVRSVGIASDGRATGLASPSARGHARSIRRAHRAASVDPATIGLVEGHGLGLRLADRAELRALRATMPAPAGRPRVLGAISSQIGHAMPASGMAGLIKTALALHHRLLPPTLGADQPHPLVGEAGFELLDAPRPWIHGDPSSPRRAGVNAFGFAGINAHALLEEHPASADGPGDGAMTDWDTEAILLAAADRPALAARARRLADRLRHRADLSLKDVAFTLNTDPDTNSGRVRLGLVASSPAELAERLETAASRLDDPACTRLRDARGIYFWDEPAGRDGRLAFVFPGQGSQYPGMLADLCPRFPEARAVLDSADRIALESGDPTPPSVHVYSAGPPAEGSLWETGTAVNAVFSAQWALFQILLRLGLKPDGLAGHSSGELPALAAAGVFDLPAPVAAGAPDADRELDRAFSRLAAVFRRLDASGEIPEARLVAVAAPRERVEIQCAGLGGSVVLAIDNCPHQVVVAVPPSDEGRLLESLRGAGLLCEQLPFARAYHTPAFARVVGPLETFYRGLKIGPPATPIYSCATARPMPADPDAILALAVEQWSRPVRFRETIESMHADGFRVFVDVGARGNLCGYVEDTLRGRHAFAVAANLPKRSGTSQLNHLVASLFAQEVPIDPAYLYLRRRPRRVVLDAPPPSRRPTVPLELGFPEMRFSDAALERFRVVASSAPPPLRQHEPAHEHPADFPGEPASSPHLFQDDSWPPSISGPGDVDEGVLSYLGTMDEFLRTQNQVMRAYLGAPSSHDAGTATVDDIVTPRDDLDTPDGSPSPGPWAGTVIELDPGRAITTRYSLDATRDPVALHHTLGGRRISSVDPSRIGLPVLPFAVMAEMVAQAARLLAPRDLDFESLHDLRAHRWVPFDDETPAIELRGLAEDPAGSVVRVTIHTVGPDGLAADKPVFEGLARFGSSNLEPRLSSLPDPAGDRPSRFTAEELYKDQWLFHGPPFQALTRVGSWGLNGTSGTLRVLPLAPLLADPSNTTFHTDPISLDVFTHLLGCWGLDALKHGEIIYPLGLGALEIRGPRPTEGTEIACRIAVREIDHFRVRVDAELVRPDGRVWMEIRDWEDWRFHWPSRYRDVFRAPDLVLLGEELPLAAPGIKAVWLAPPPEMARPVWRDVLEQIQLSPGEWSTRASLPRIGPRRSRFLFGRIAAKEAVRRLWSSPGGIPRYPADLEIAGDRLGRPILQDLDRPDFDSLPSLSIAHTEGVAIGLAATDPWARLGVDIESIQDRSAGFEEVAFTATERNLLSAWPGDIDRSEAIARLWCAKEAAAKATGLGFQGNLSLAQATAVRPDGQTVVVSLSGPLADAWGGTPMMLVYTSRRGDHAWAWTRGEGA